MWFTLIMFEAVAMDMLRFRAQNACQFVKMLAFLANARDQMSVPAMTVIE